MDMGNGQTYDEMVAETAAKLRTRTQKKEEARVLLLHGIGDVLGYWTENNAHTVEALGSDDAVTEFGEILKREADRIARMLGYEEAWTN
ncbi:hypothetical protein BKA00_007418 [Actinomadura coerulea]|uniref:Uncharacterized protein n=1 Tax=Actinomadura coerulea TaxID=46159 RepID=A0A7X0L3Q3_9ACTN|nr:hypothetical protein [Actinomadura coerulea]MBB6400504.1 hypothetical protein [Actinomadura coerulea]GGQ07715.1 hypothetical protein GCM10010187_24690 [Actinomadura coerulea]